MNNFVETAIACGHHLDSMLIYEEARRFEELYDVEIDISKPKRPYGRQINIDMSFCVKNRNITCIGLINLQNYIDKKILIENLYLIHKELFYKCHVFLISQINTSLLGGW